MAQSNWINLVTQGLTLVDRANNLLTRSMQQRAAPAQPGTAQGRGIDPQRMLHTAHRIMDVLEGKPQRRGFFW